MAHLTSGTNVHGETARPTMGERIKEAIPGTDEYRATHGVTGAHANAQNVKSHIPGTDEHRMRDAGVVGGTAGTGLAGEHHGVHPTMTERVKEAIPGTREYEATHGMTGAHQGVQQAKAHIPGTEEHRIATSMEPGYGTGAGIGSGMGTGHMGSGEYSSTTGPLGGHHHTTADTMAGTGVGAGMGAGMGAHHGTHTTGAGMTGVGAEHEGVGHKIKKHIPGTREHEEKKVTEGRI